MDDNAAAEAKPRSAQGTAADIARNDRRERLECGMAEILRLERKWEAKEFCRPGVRATPRSVGRGFERYRG
jgi:hypothetical protein